MSAGDKGVTNILGLRKRMNFLRVSKEGFRISRPSFILLVCKWDEKAASELPANACRVGYTTSKKVGNAVQRNRCRRRLRAVVREVMPKSARPGYDYVLIAKTYTLTVEYAAMLRELQTALADNAK